MILGIDTSAAQCAVALLGAGDPVVERRAMERGHAEHLFPMIESALERVHHALYLMTRDQLCAINRHSPRLRLRRPSAIPRAAATPMRTPVKDPGPVQTAIRPTPS